MFILLAKWAILAVAVWVTSRVVPGIRVESKGTALVVAGVYGVLNASLHKIVFYLTFPLALLTLGLIVNVVLLWVTDKLLDDFEIREVPSLFIGALSISFISWGLQAIVL